MSDYQYPIPDAAPMLGKDPDVGTQVDVWEGEYRLSKHGRHVELWKGPLGWMGTHPGWHAQYAAHGFLKRVAAGALLVAGLGVSFDANRVAGQVSHMTIVEESREVIVLAGDLAPSNSTIIERSIEDYLADVQLRSPQFDTVYFDHTEEGSSDSDQARLMRLLDGWLRPGAQVVFWQTRG